MRTVQHLVSVGGSDVIDADTQLFPRPGQLSERRPIPRPMLIIQLCSLKTPREQLSKRLMRSGLLVIALTRFIFQ